MAKASACPKRYLVDLGRTTYRGGNVPGIRKTVYRAFSPEQALGWVLKNNGLSYLYDALAPEVNELVTESTNPMVTVAKKEEQKPAAELSDHGPAREPDWKQGELFEIPRHYEL
jgi:hypothetical protein